MLDTANALTNLISGISVLCGDQLPNGDFCTVTGFIGQATIQSSDISVMLMALITYATFITNPSSVSARMLLWLQSRKWVLVVPLLVVPLTTAGLALLYPGYERSSFTWCWIASEPPYARYLYAHGLRLCVMFLLPFIYGSMYFKIRSAYREAKETDLARRAIEAEWESCMTPPRNFKSRSNTSNNMFAEKKNTILISMGTAHDHDTVILEDGEVSSYFETLESSVGSIQSVGAPHKSKRKGTTSRTSSLEMNKLKQLKCAMELMIALPIVCKFVQV